MIVSVKQILTKAWEDCKKEGVELNSVEFEFFHRVGVGSGIVNIEYGGRAIEKPQKQPDE